MWISGFCLRAATDFSPQAAVWKEEVFHRLVVELWEIIFVQSFPHRIFPQSTGTVEKIQGRKIPMRWLCTFLASPRKVPKEGDLRGR